MYKYLFGPVPSRRLGVSLGVDLVTHKVCSLDCVYCECGDTTQLTLERKEYVPYKEVIEELDHYFANHPAPNYITFSGSGEPTLNSRIGDVIEYIKIKKHSCTATAEVKEELTATDNTTAEVKEELTATDNTTIDKSDISVAVLTNGTLLGDKDVRDALLKADLVMPSLDAASLSAFERINRPHAGINLNDHIQGLVDFRQVYKGRMALEILILPGFNDSIDELKLLKDACYRINPDVIQLNTLDRPGTISTLTSASREILENIKTLLQSDYTISSMQVQSKDSLKPIGNIKPLEVEIIASSPLCQDNRAYRTDMESAILETIHRRPCTLEDLTSILGSHINEINKYLSTLEHAGKIVSVSQKRGIFYHSVK